MNKYVKYMSILIMLMAFAATAAAAAQPVITAVTTDTPTASSVNITWTTDENSNSLVKYGDTSGTYPDNRSSGVMEISHSIELTGLNANMTYYYVVNSTNATGSSNESSVDHFTTASAADTTAPVITAVTAGTPTASSVNITWTTDENSNSLVKYGIISGTYPDNISSETMEISHSIELTGLNANTTYYYVVNSTDGSGNSNEGGELNFMTGAGSSSDTTPPTISDLENTTTPDTATITWTTNEDSDSLVKYDTDSGAPYEYNKSSDTPEQDHSIKLTGLEADTTYYFKVNSTDGSGNSIESSQSTFKTKPSGHSTGYRVWEEGMDTTYTWDARSFTGFYYDLDDDTSTEKLIVHNIDRNIEEGDLEYVTEAADIDFECSEWGKYKVIGFMAEKYFAGYGSETKDKITSDTISLVSKDMLSKVLIDEDEKHTISTGASLELEDGYELKIIQLDTDGNQAQIELLKNGKSVDTDIVRSPDTYVYTKDLGKLDDVPLVAVNINSVFSGTESDMLVIEGIFQISDGPISVDTGNDYGDMEIKSSSGYTIKMENTDAIDLEEGEIVDIMGNLKFLVADDSSTLRFALYEEITEPGTHDIRGTVYNTTEKPTWDHMNFEGFYYDIDDNLGTERLVVEECSGNTIPENKLVYITEPDSVGFDLGRWGSYEVIGFMAEKYFAGYGSGTKKELTSDTLSLISKDMLSKVLVDVEDDRMISTGASLPLCEGYELKIIQLDTDGGQAQLELLKNGKSVDTDIVRSPDTYVYTKDLGKLDDVPIIAIRIGNVFSGTETDMVTIEGAFQISDDPISIDTGDEYGDMEITSASSSGITMKNKENDIDLEGDETIMITDTIGFKVSEDEDRYYLFVRRTIGSLDSLEIEFSETPVVDEELTITVTAASDGDPVEGVEVTFEGENLGLTDSDGKVRFTSEEAGTFTIRAAKKDYDSASEDVRILTEEEVVEDKLEIAMLEEVEPGEDVVIKVTSDGDAIEGASVIWDGEDIGETDETGSLTYTTEDAGTYTVTASKAGYLNASEEIKVAFPSAEFELADLTFPAEVSANKKFTITVDVTNTGDADGTYLAELMVDGTAADSTSVDLDAGETTTVEFTHKISKAGTYTIEIGSESGEVAVTKAESNTALVAAALIVLAALGAIGYVLISSAPEGGWTVERLIEAIKDKFRKGGERL